MTKKECEAKIDGVCSGCGGKLVALKTVDNSGTPTHWGGCKHCSKFYWGVNRKIWEIARELEINYSKDNMKMGRHKNFKDTYFIRVGNWFVNFGLFIALGRLKPNKVWFLTGVKKVKNLI